MANTTVVTVENNRYKLEPGYMYQWDLNQVLKIYGLSLGAVPEIHFVNADMDRALVRQASMDSAGVVSVNVPNSLLQKALKLKVYVCTYERNTFQTQYLIEIPVKARPKPADYTLEVTDEEVYSFNALENQVANALTKIDGAESAYLTATAEMETAKNNLETAQANLLTAVENYNNAVAEVAQYQTMIDNAVNPDAGLDPTSTRPIQNQAVTQAFMSAFAMLGGLSFMALTQDEYDALDSVDDNTIYFITE